MSERTESYQARLETNQVSQKAWFANVQADRSRLRHAGHRWASGGTFDPRAHHPRRLACTLSLLQLFIR